MSALRGSEERGASISTPAYSSRWLLTIRLLHVLTSSYARIRRYWASSILLRQNLPPSSAATCEPKKSRRTMPVSCSPTLILGPHRRRNVRSLMEQILLQPKFFYAAWISPCERLMHSIFLSLNAWGRRL